MKTFQVTIEERGLDGRVRTIRQTAQCESRQQVIDFYGLNDADVLSYEITDLA